MYARPRLREKEPEERPAVILVHGLIVSSRYMVPTLRQLVPRHRAYAADLPGFGKSANPSRVLNVSGLSGALAAWMGAVGLKSAVLVGNSLGRQNIVAPPTPPPERVVRA